MTTKDLSELIKQNTRVILPEFGAFLVKESSEKGFNPINLTFSPFLRYNDGMLEVHIAKNKGISKDEASKLIRSYIEQIKNELQEKGLFQIEDLGYLKRDSRGSISFMLNENVKPHKQSGGVEDKKDNVVEPKKSPVVETKKPETTNVPEVEEKRDPWAEDPTEESKQEGQKRFRRIEGKRAQVEKLTISRVPINNDLTSGDENKTGTTEEIRSYFVPVEKDTTTKKEEIKEETILTNNNIVEPKIQVSTEKTVITESNKIIAEETSVTKTPIPEEAKPKKAAAKRKKSTPKPELEIIENIEATPTELTPDSTVHQETVLDQEPIHPEFSKSELIEIEAPISDNHTKEELVEVKTEKKVIADKVVVEKEVVETRKEEKLKKKVEVFTDDDEDNSYRSIYITFGVIALLVIAFFIGRNYLFKSGSNELADSLQVASNAVDDIEDEGDINADDIDKSFEELSNETSENKANTEVEKVQAETEEAIKQSVIENASTNVVKSVKYYLIVGSFKNLDYANKFSENLVKSGYKTEIILQKSGMHAVSIDAFNTRDEAANKQSTVLEKFPGAWILKQ